MFFFAFRRRHDRQASAPGFPAPVSPRRPPRPLLRSTSRGHGLLKSAMGLLAGLTFSGCMLPQPPPGHGPAAGAPSLDTPVAIERQGSFFVGGRELASDTLATLAVFGSTGTITVDQMYVRYQVASGAARTAVVFIHGCCLTGKSWETTPDGRMGWDEYFVRAGFPTYVVDQASRGRSASDPTGIVSARMGRSAPQDVPNVFAARREGAWTIFRFGPEYGQAFAGLQFPLDAQAELWKQMVPDWSATLPVPNPTVPALSQLVQRLGSAVLVSHSQSGIYPFQAAALSRRGIAGIVAIEPGACPAPDSDMTPYAGIPSLLLFGDYVDQSPDLWLRRLQNCQAFADAANRAGARIELLRLPDAGFHGNSHMIMQDRNSLQVAGWLSAWIARNVERQNHQQGAQKAE